MNETYQNTLNDKPGLVAAEGDGGLSKRPYHAPSFERTLVEDVTRVNGGVQDDGDGTTGS